MAYKSEDSSRFDNSFRNIGFLVPKAILDASFDLGFIALGLVTNEKLWRLGLVIFLQIEKIDFWTNIASSIGHIRIDIWYEKWTGNQNTLFEISFMVLGSVGLEKIRFEGRLSKKQKKNDF